MALPLDIAGFLKNTHRNPKLRKFQPDLVDRKGGNGYHFGLIIELSGMALFELAVPRMGDSHKTARLTFYMIANWFLIPISVTGLCWWLSFYVRTIPRLHWEVACLSCYFLLCAIITAVLAVLRRCQTVKK